MKKVKDSHKPTTYEWLKLDQGNMPLKICINPNKGIRIVSEQAAFEIPMRYAVSESIVKRLRDKQIEEVQNELSFMLSVIQMFSDEKMRNLFFALVDMNYHLITNAKDYKPFEFKDIDPKRNPDKYLEQQLESVQHFNDIRDKALEPLDEVFELLTRIKEEHGKID